MTPGRTLHSLMWTMPSQIRSGGLGSNEPGRAAEAAMTMTWSNPHDSNNRPSASGSPDAWRRRRQWVRPPWEHCAHGPLNASRLTPGMDRGDRALTRILHAGPDEG